ncbi:hypothetical protein MTP99_001468 [Tenebrio molitor]|nr:hypothetical protein MTP99_001468 [Tenebrio molitor]
MTRSKIKFNSELIDFDASASLSLRIGRLRGRSGGRETRLMRQRCDACYLCCCWGGGPPAAGCVRTGCPWAAFPAGRSVSWSVACCRRGSSSCREHGAALDHAVGCGR